jgi:hypothetical protein
MSKKKKLKEAEKLLMQMPQPERSIFLHKLLIASGVIKPKGNDTGRIS